MKAIYTFSLYLLGILVLLYTGCKQPEDQIIHISKDEYSVEDQQKIGQNLQRLINANSDYFQILDRDAYSEVYSYIQTLWQSQVNTQAVGRRDSLAWEVTVLHDDEMELAYILPGGKFFVSTGLLHFLEGENELVSLMAYAIYFVETNTMVEYMKAEYGELLLGDILLDKDNEEIRALTETVSSIAFDPEIVKAADAFAQALICPFQYDALGLKQFIDKAMQQNVPPDWIEKHPVDNERLELITNNASNCGVEEPTFSDRYNFYKDQLP